MLLIQEELRRGKQLLDLSESYGLSLTYHDTLPLVIVNYDQIDSPKYDPLACQCRGLVLELDTWNVVAKSFDRFFNLGEDQERQKDFVWNDCYCNEKLDGSLVLLYCYEGNWLANTRGSFAQGEINDSGVKWQDLIWQCLNTAVDLTQLNPECTYVFELCSLYNKVVTEYCVPFISLLTIVNNRTLQEYNQHEVDVLHQAIGIKSPRPINYYFNSVEAVKYAMDIKGKENPTFEGFVLMDRNGMRIKCKTTEYISLFHLRGNNNIFSPKYLVPLVLKGEIEEVVTYFKEVEPHLRMVADKIGQAENELIKVWQRNHDKPTKKEFALSVIGQTPFVSLLFTAYEKKCCVRALFRNSPDLVRKVLFPKESS